MSESPRLEELRRRVQADPASIAFAALAEEYRRASRFREAVETARAGLRHHPTYVSARVTLGRSLVELQEFDQAERELAFVLRSAPDNLAARRALGEICWQQLRFADALEHFHAAQGLAPNDKDIPGIINSLERELEAERAATAPAPVASASAAADAAGLAADDFVVERYGAPDSLAHASDYGPPAPASTSTSPDEAASPAHAANGPKAPVSNGIAALERFYRAIVRARGTPTAPNGGSPPPSTHATGS
jgi:tetratricopeptide (TPR) repeat protein